MCAIFSRRPSGLPVYFQFDAPYAQPIARRERRPFDPFIVHERAIGAPQIDDLQLFVTGGQSAVQPRYQRRIDNEIGPRRPAEGLHGSSLHPKDEGIAFRPRTLQDPHTSSEGSPVADRPVARRFEAELRYPRSNFRHRFLVTIVMARGTTGRRTVVYTAIGIAVAIIAGAAGFATLKGAGADLDPSRLAAVERGTMVRSVVATGKVEPITKVEIKSKANGIIKALHVDVDSVVNPGDVLVELDKEQLMAALRGAEANLQAARASLVGAEAQLRKNRIEAEGPDVAFARRAYERAQSLFAERLIAQSALDDSHSAVDVAENRKHAAVSQLVVSEAKVTEARAQVAQAQAAADRAAEDVANATIRAPIRATVLTRDVELGSPVSSILNLGANATLVMTLGDIDQVFVRGKVDEADIGRVRLRQPARIRVETFKDKIFNGCVTQISPMGVEKDNVTNFEVRVSIDNADKALKANMTANAEIVLEEHAGALLVPEAAITYDARKNAFVDVVDSGAKNGRRKTSVKVGVGNGTKIEILDDVRLGDKVVLPT